MWIRREIEENWPELSREYPILVVTGPRQVGKTSLLERIYGEQKLVSLDLPRLAEEAEAVPESFLARLDFPAIIDEVQYAPSLFRPLKHWADTRLKGKEAQVLLTGSERFSLMKEVSESLAGRAGIIEFSTLGLKELERWSGRVAQGRQLIEWLLVGGYPKLHAEQLSVPRFYSNLVSTYIERDVKRLANIQNTRAFDRFMRMTALRTGQLLSMNAIATDIGVSQTTVKNWMAVLQASGIVDLVDPWWSNGNKRLVKTPKLYFNDTGLCLFLAGVETVEELQRSPLLGSFFETLCYGQLKRFYTNQGLLPRIHFFRTQDGVEIDFVIAHGTEFTAFECKFSENPSFNESAISAFEKVAKGPVRATYILNSGRHPYRVSGSGNVFAVSCVDAGMNMNPKQG